MSIFIIAPCPKRIIINEKRRLRDDSRCLQVISHDVFKRAINQTRTTAKNTNPEKTRFSFPSQALHQEALYLHYAEAKA